MIGDKYFLRMAIGSAKTTQIHVKEAWNKIAETAQRIIEGQKQ
jgi:hypothetical protein